MGLDLAEIYMDLEDHFGVNLEDLNAVDVTVADLQLAVVQRLFEQSQMTVAALEQDVCEAFGIAGQDLDRPLVNAVVDLREKIPLLCVKPWRQLPKRMRRPRSMIAAIWAIPAIPVTCSVVAAPAALVQHALALLAAAIPMGVLAYATDGWRPRLPDFGTTTGNQVITAAAKRFQEQSRWFEHGHIRREVVDAEVIAIIGRFSAANPQGIQPQHRLIKDLGLG